MSKRNGVPPQESKLIHEIDARDEWLNSLTNDELNAIQIVCGSCAPTATTGKGSRRWAVAIVNQIIQSRFASLAVRRAFREAQLDDLALKLFEYFVPKPKQALELTGADDGPVKFQREPTYEEMLAAALIVNGQQSLDPPESNE